MSIFLMRSLINQQLIDIYFLLFLSPPLPCFTPLKFTSPFLHNALLSSWTMHHCKFPLQITSHTFTQVRHLLYLQNIYQHHLYLFYHLLQLNFFHQQFLQLYFYHQRLVQLLSNGFHYLKLFSHNSSYNTLNGVYFLSILPLWNHHCTLKQFH